GYSISYVPDMVILHPARKSFDGVFTKWDRQIAHDYCEYPNNMSGRARWVMRALAVAVSPITEVPRILGSTRVASARERFLAMLALIRIRLYRARRMLELISREEKTSSSKSWNRS